MPAPKKVLTSDQQAARQAMKDRCIAAGAKKSWEIDLSKYDPMLDEATISEVGVVSLKRKGGYSSIIVTPEEWVEECMAAGITPYVR